MPFELPDLPYPYDALEPHIDAETMRIHHDLHHKAYVDNANAALAGTEWDGRPVEQVLADLELIPEEKRTAVRNNAGGHANHKPVLADHEPGRRRRSRRRARGGDRRRRSAASTR